MPGGPLTGLAAARAEVFRGAQPDDGLLELGLVTARNPAERARALGRVMQGRAGESPFVEVTRGKAEGLAGRWCDR